MNSNPPSPPGRDIFTVSRLNREARALVEGAFSFLWIQGEVSNLARPASGHLYFSLKDAQCQVRCAMFRQYQRPNMPPLKDGMHVILRARASVYEGRGEFQLIVEHLEDAGEGALKQAFEVLKARLAAEGLFDRERKRTLPRLPRCIGVVTSPTGAVLHDIVTTLRRRFPAIAVRLYAVPVQGQGAADKIARAIYRAGREPLCDAIIVARGGGSLEDLWAFNEEIVARAIHNCPLPVVVGVGHETDVTIADFVADARAPTPTAAAEMLSPHWEEWYERYRQAETRLTRMMRARLQQTTQHLDGMSARLVHPRRRLDLLRLRLRSVSDDLRRAAQSRLLLARHHAHTAIAQLNRSTPQPRVVVIQHRLRLLYLRLVSSGRLARTSAHERLGHSVTTLNALSPLSTLARGYSILTNAAGVIVRRTTQVDPGESIHARLADGILDCRVDRCRRD